MSRFVLVSFAFMGWGFYELSGGADFQPPERPTMATAEVNLQTAAITSAPTAPEVQDHRNSGPVLTRRSQLQSPVRPPADPGLRQRVAAENLVKAANILSSTQTAFSTDTNGAMLQLASLEGGLAAITSVPVATTAETAVIPEAETTYDRRNIRASRVNMRQGPGTNYPIITRLLAGDEVIVIEDSGTGWLHLRAPDKGHVGWIAASLVSKKRP